MITGFTNHALLVFPDEEVYDGRSHSYIGKMLKAVEKIREYLNMCDITLDCFATDSVAVDKRVQCDRWIGTLGQGDMFFAKRNCEGIYTNQTRILNIDDAILKAAEQYPIDRGMSFDTRFEATLKRDAKAKRLIADKYKLLVLFTVSKGMPIKYKHKLGTMCIEIGVSNFIPTVYMADTKINPIDVLGVPNGNAPVYEWEVNNCLR